MIDEKIPSYKPLPRKSKYARVNEVGQCCKNCVNFNFVKPNCVRSYKVGIGKFETVEGECVLLKGEICNSFVGKLINE